MKMKVGVLFGGKSVEHEVSIVSARMVLTNIDKDKYEIYPVGITKEGQWLLYEGGLDELNVETWQQHVVPIILSPDATQKCFVKITENKIEEIPLDVVFPVLHGTYGEDGCVQGLLELSGIPYVGCGVLTSSVSMDKVFTKIIVGTTDIDQAKYNIVYREDIENIDNITMDIQQNLGYPCFVKPANGGSSVGITKAHNKEELVQGIKQAFLYDKKVLVEEGIVGRELECAVLGNDKIEVSGVGEIIPAKEFYDYNAKYNDASSKVILDPKLKEEIVAKIRKNARDIFKLLDGRGMSRIDFFLQKDTERVIFNEINTIPGFTSISMYPMLFEKQGITKTNLINRLIELTIQNKKVGV